MAYFHPDLLGKFANPDFALTVLHDNHPHGEFKALVRFAQADKRYPDLKVIEVCSDDLLKVRIRCDQIESFIEDRNVLRVELSEYVSNSTDVKAFED